LWNDESSGSALRRNMALKLRRSINFAYDKEAHINMITTSGNTKIFNPFDNPERQFQTRKNTTPLFVHNIYSFYESESSESESKETGWHDGSPSQSICGSNSSDGMASIASKLDNFGRDMKKLKENVHVIQVGCQLCGGLNLRQGNASMERDGILEDYWRKVENEKMEDFKEYGESKTNAILKISLEMEDETWFSSTSDVKNDLGGIIDQLKPNLQDKSTDPDKENHQERKCKLLGIIYKEPPPILIEKIEVTRFNIGPGETYTKTKILGIDEIPRISTNVATVRAVLMDEFGADGSTQGAT
ncbi:hypothetical protein Tco_1198736, partial [Tanacetum coccineum]